MKTVAEDVQKRVHNGDLRGALCLYSNIPNSSVDSIVRQAEKEQILSGRHVDNGSVRQALKKGGWKSLSIDFLIFRDPADGSEPV